MQIYQTESAIAPLISKAPLYLLISMGLSFLLMFIVQLFYYAGIFTPLLPQSAFAYVIGGGIGVMYQAARLSFGLSGAYEFSNGKSSNGIIGILFSFALTFYESYEVTEIAHYWGNEAGSELSILYALQAIVWLGFALEIRLAMNVAKKMKKANAKRVAEEEALLEGNGNFS